MKKLLVLAVMAAVAFSACTNEYYTIEGPDEYLNSRTYYITVNPKLAPAGDWHERNTGGDFYIFAEKNLSAITTDVIENGMVLVYYIGDYDNLLPYIRSYAAGHTEFVRYDIERGKITFIIEATDNVLPEAPDNYDMEFKVVVVEKMYNY